MDYKLQNLAHFNSIIRAAKKRTTKSKETVFKEIISHSNFNCRLDAHSVEHSNQYMEAMLEAVLEKVDQRKGALGFKNLDQYCKALHEEFSKVQYDFIYASNDDEVIKAKNPNFVHDYMMHYVLSVFPKFIKSEQRKVELKQ